MKTETQQRITKALHAIIDVLIVAAIGIYMIYLIKYMD